MYWRRANIRCGRYTGRARVGSAQHTVTCLLVCRVWPAKGGRARGGATVGGVLGRGQGDGCVLGGAARSVGGVEAVDDDGAATLILRGASEDEVAAARGQQGEEGEVFSGRNGVLQ